MCTSSSPSTSKRSDDSQRWDCPARVRARSAFVLGLTVHAVRSSMKWGAVNPPSKASSDSDDSDASDSEDEETKRERARREKKKVGQRTALWGFGVGSGWDAAAAC
eukprot:2258354-Rhodomonas_salina.2